MKWSALAEGLGTEAQYPCGSNASAGLTGLIFISLYSLAPFPGCRSPLERLGKMPFCLSPPREHNTKSLRIP